MSTQRNTQHSIIIKKIKIGTLMRNRIIPLAQAITKNVKI